MLDLLPGETYAVDPTSAFPIAGDSGMALGTGTGQHGITPLVGEASTVGEAINDTWNWLNKPFTAPMSPAGIALIVGAVLVSVILWNFILYHIRIAAETI